MSAPPVQGRSERSAARPAASRGAGRPGRSRHPAAEAIVLVVAMFPWLLSCGPSTPAEPTSPTRPASSNPVTAPGTAALPSRTVLTVRTTRLTAVRWDNSLSAGGSVAPAQEIGVASELAGARIVRVLVEAGDPVQRGQVLAELAAPSVTADLSAAEAAYREAQAQAVAARETTRRARELQPSGAISAQQLREYLSTEQALEARLQGLQARWRGETARRAALRLTAPETGVVLARPVLVGNVVQPGQELFRLMQGGRLEWRAELATAELGQIHAGQRVTVLSADGREVAATVRRIAPGLDTATRQAIVHVALSPDPTFRVGAYTRGVFHLGEVDAQTLPATALQVVDGTSQVFTVQTGGQIVRTPVRTGRRLADRIEILGGVAPDAEVVADGVAFLQDGDPVRVVNEPPAMARP